MKEITSVVLEWWLEKLNALSDKDSEPVNHTFRTLAKKDLVQPLNKSVLKFTLITKNIP